MKRNRIIWLITWILSLVVISFFGGPVSYGFFIMVTFVPVISFVYLILVYFFFHMYQRIDSKWLVANQTIPFYFTLMNDYHFVFSGIRVKFYSSFSSISGLSEDIEYELLPNTGITKETSLVCKYRGEYEVGIKNVIIQDYFRLFRFSYHNREPLRVQVRPQLVHLDNLRGIDISAAMRESVMNASEPDVLVRAYVPGDDIRQVHWGITAKSGELMIRKKTGEEQQGIGILMSTQRISKTPEVYLSVENKMLEAVLALSLFFTEKGIPVTHFHHASELVMRRLARIDQFDEHYDALSGVEFSNDREDAILFEASSQCRTLFESRAVFMVLHEWSEAAGEMMHTLSENNIYVVVYLINDSISEDVLAQQLPRVEFIKIAPEDNLLEVM